MGTEKGLHDTTKVPTIKEVTAIIDHESKNIQESAKELANIFLDSLNSTHIPREEIEMIIFDWCNRQIWFVAPVNGKLTTLSTSIQNADFNSVNIDSEKKEERKELLQKNLWLFYHNVDTSLLDETSLLHNFIKINALKAEIDAYKEDLAKKAEEHSNALSPVKETKEGVMKTIALDHENNLIDHDVEKEKIQKEDDKDIKETGKKINKDINRDYYLRH